MIRKIALFTVLLAVLSGPAAAAGFDTGVTATQMAIAMGVPAGMITSASLYSVGTTAADPKGYGVYTGSLGSYTPSEGSTFAVITCCDVSLIPGSNTSSGVTYDQNTQNGKGAENGGDDVVKLQIVINPPDTAQSFSFDFVFLSEEYPEWVGSAFNDFFIVEKDGHALTYDTTGGAAKASSVYNITKDQQGQVISVNANFFKENSNQNTGTQFDGWTPVLTTCASLANTDSLILTFSIGDLGDAALMSAAYIDNFQFSTEPSSNVTFNKATQVVLGGTTSKLEVYSYPNPYLPNLGGLVTFRIPAGLCPLLCVNQGIERVEIFDLAGRRIALVTGTPATTMTWNGTNMRGERVASGIYYYFVRTNDGRTGTGRFTLVR